MKNLTLRRILFWIWSQPQTAIGYLVQFFVVMFNKVTIIDYNYVRAIYFGRNWGGISLGKFIFMCNEMMFDDKYTIHELGHSIQSLYLGPLYLLVIGIPSLLRAFYVVIRPKSAATYHNFYTETWADALGGKNK